jgi:hypothetical protein
MLLITGLIDSFFLYILIYIFNVGGNGELAMEEGGPIIRQTTD